MSAKIEEAHQETMLANAIVEGLVDGIEDYSGPGIARMRVRFSNGLSLSVVSGEFIRGYEIAALDEADDIDETLLGFEVRSGLGPTEVRDYVLQLAAMKV